MMLRNATSGQFELYDINNNAITAASSPGTVGINWLVAGFGNFSSNPGETDMLLRNALSGEFEVYDIRNNVIVSAFSLGTVGIDWQVAGFGPVSGTGHSDMVLRNITRAHSRPTTSPTIKSRRPARWVRSAWIRKLSVLPPIRPPQRWAPRTVRTLNSCKRWPALAAAVARTR
jgi:hypothetical protein